MSRETYFQKLCRERDAAKALAQAEADAKVAGLRREISAVTDAVAVSVAAEDTKFHETIAEQRAFAAKTEHHELKGLLAALLKQPNRSKVSALIDWIVRVDGLSVETTNQPLDPWFLLHAMQVATVKYGDVSPAARDAAFSLYAHAKANQIPLAETAWDKLEEAFARHTDAGHWEIEKANRVLSGALDSSGIRVIWDKLDAERKAFEARENTAEYERIRAAREAKTPEPAPTKSAADVAKALSQRFAELLA